MTLTTTPIKMTTSAGVILRGFMTGTVGEPAQKVNLDEWFMGV
jgi:hypothetical protein